MTIKYYKCRLLTDIVINASLATEGNMKTLDYIPGSNFLGIVASKLYPQLKEEEEKREALMNIFHSGKVSFGDAHLSVDGTQSYSIPFSLFKNKLDKEITGDITRVWVHHLLNENNLPETEGRKIQLKQVRNGYLNPNNYYIPKVGKRFALKSAQSRTERRSEDKKMFGFESMKKGQEFIFSVHFDNSIDKETIEKVGKILIGDKRVGKSKSAQYGQVNIKAIDKPPVFENGESRNDLLIIYAQSNLCFFNEYGQSTFKPCAKDFKVDGKIDWSLSQIRTYSYSPWNSFRNTTDTQRDCIKKGSVLVIKLNDATKIDLEELPNKVGAFQAEGLGRVLYNPDFLQADEETAEWRFERKRYSIETQEQKSDSDSLPEANSSLGKFLVKRKGKIDGELAIGIAVQKVLNGSSPQNVSYKSIFKKIPSSQWGGIRNKAIQANDMEELIKELFGKEGMLMKGVASDNYWNKKKGLARNTLQQIINDNKLLRPAFIAKLAAEMAKQKQ